MSSNTNWQCLDTHAQKTHSHNHQIDNQRMLHNMKHCQSEKINTHSSAHYIHKLVIKRVKTLLQHLDPVSSVVLQTSFTVKLWKGSDAMTHFLCVYSPQDRQVSRQRYTWGIRKGHTLYQQQRHNRERTERGVREALPGLCEHKIPPMECRTQQQVKIRHKHLLRHWRRGWPLPRPEKCLLFCLLVSTDYTVTATQTHSIKEKSLDVCFFAQTNTWLIHSSINGKFLCNYFDTIMQF